MELMWDMHLPEHLCMCVHVGASPTKVFGMLPIYLSRG